MSNTRTYDQPPSGGCNYCGNAVWTRKDGEWICWRCVKEGRDQNPRGEPTRP